ncbi:MAG: T9SS type A sorting domain-containing protein [Bacteroidota bacterium]
MRLFLLGIALLPTLALAQPVDYFPLETTDVWVYGSIDTRSTPPDTFRLDPTRIRGSVIIHDTAYVLVSFPGVPTDTLRKDGEGRVWSRINNADHLLFDVTLQDGDTYTYPFNDYFAPGILYTVTVTRPMDTVVAAGAFSDAIRFRFDTNEVTDSNLGVILAPDVGVVYGHNGWGSRELIEGNAPRVVSTPERLEQNTLHAFPNPFSSSLTVELPRGDWQTLELVDALGRHVAAMQTAPCSTSSCRLTWDGMDVPPGVYTVRAVSPTGTLRQRVVRMR